MRSGIEQQPLNVVTDMPSGVTQKSQLAIPALSTHFPLTGGDVETDDAKHWPACNTCEGSGNANWVVLEWVGF